MDTELIDSNKPMRWFLMDTKSDRFEQAFDGYEQRTSSNLYRSHLAHLNSDLPETWSTGFHGFACHVLSITARSGLGQKSSISMMNLRCTIEIND